MRYGIYSIRDRLTGFLSPALEVSDASAIRNFVHAVGNANSLFFTHAADYDLYKIGEFETDTGELFHNIPEITILGIDAKQMYERSVDHA